jgi:hypothetical protein
MVKGIIFEMTSAGSNKTAGHNECRQRFTLRMLDRGVVHCSVCFYVILIPEPPNGIWETHVGIVHDEVDNASFGIATEALVAVASRVYHEVAKMVVIMEWAKGCISYASLLQSSTVTGIVGTEEVFHDVFNPCYLKDSVNYLFVNL